MSGRTSSGPVQQPSRPPSGRSSTQQRTVSGVAVRVVLKRVLDDGIVVHLVPAAQVLQAGVEWRRRMGWRHVTWQHRGSAPLRRFCTRRDSRHDRLVRLCPFSTAALPAGRTCVTLMLGTGEMPSSASSAGDFSTFASRRRAATPATAATAARTFIILGGLVAAGWRCGGGAPSGARADIRSLRGRATSIRAADGVATST